MRTLIIVSIIVAGVFGTASAAPTDWRNEVPVKLHINAFDDIRLGPQPGANFVTVALSFGPFENILIQTEARLGRQLKSRGEAHITVVTPPEFAKLSEVLTAQEIRNVIASGFDSLDAEPVCVGSGAIGKDETWFVVLQSSPLLQARMNLEDRFNARGGLLGNFSAANFYPHVTIGFVNRDLHLEDGIVKDVLSCKFPLSEFFNAPR
jgi:hypothetical protein